MTVSRPLLRYYGGKWAISQTLVNLMPPHKIYVELFGGGGSVLLRKPRAKLEFYNDLDSAVVNLFRVLRNPEHAAELHRQLELTPFAREEHAAAYEPTDDAIEAARRLLVRNWMSYTARGTYQNVGFIGSNNTSDTDKALSWVLWTEHLPQIIERLRGVHIENRDALDLITGHDTPDTLFYADPPYVAETRSLDNVYTHEMTNEQHIALSEALHTVQGKVILSGYRSDLYDTLYADWELTTTKSNYGTKGQFREECIWTNYSVPKQLALF